jgi:hypothetical protein
VLRQLARLTRPVPAAGPAALALAVYSDPEGGLVVAKESGFEGVACVDDAARVLDVLCGVWERTHDPEIERWARGLLEFVLWMKGDDGRWWNFIYDWSGTRNETGLTSSTGENFWHARALGGVSRAWLTFGDERALAATRRGLEHAVARPAPSDVRALHLIVGLRLLGEASFPGVRSAARAWADEIAANRIGDVLMNNPDERGEPHLWAHVQEGVLVDAGGVFDDPGLIDTACASARALWKPLVQDGFDRPSVSPYDASCAVYSLERLAGVDAAAWAELAAAARAWFDRTDASGRSVYDRHTGRVADGIDRARVSHNSGTEANVVAAEALFDAAVASASDAVELLPAPSNG